MNYVINTDNVNFNKKTISFVDETIKSMLIYIENTIHEINNFSLNDIENVFKKIIGDIVIFNIINYKDNILKLYYNKFTTIDINILSFYRDIKINKILNKNK